MVQRYWKNLWQLRSSLPFEKIIYLVNYKSILLLKMNFGMPIFSDVEELDCVGPRELTGMWLRRGFCL